MRGMPCSVGKGSQERARQPQRHAHRDADDQNDAGTVAAHERQQRGFASEIALGEVR